MLGEQIYINFKEESDKADRISEAAVRMKQVAAVQVENALNNARRGWQGENSNLYKKYCNKLLTEINETVENMNKAASTIRKAAMVMYTVEMAQIQRAFL